MPFSFAHIFLDTLKVFVFSVTLLYTFQKSKYFQSFRIFVYNTQAGGSLFLCGAELMRAQRAKRVINSWGRGLGTVIFELLYYFQLLLVILGTIFRVIIEFQKIHFRIKFNQSQQNLLQGIRKFGRISSQNLSIFIENLKSRDIHTKKQHIYIYMYLPNQIKMYINQ